MAFCFKKTMKDIIMAEKDEEDYKNKNNYRLCEKIFEPDKIGDHSHLAGKYRGSAQKICNINIRQKQSNFIPCKFYIFSQYDCRLFFKKLVDKKIDKVNFYFIPNTNEDYISVTYGCIRFIDSCRFLSSSSDSLVKTLVNNSHKTLKDFREEIVDNDEFLNFVNGTEIIFKEDRYNNDSIKDIKKDYPENIEKIEEALLYYIGENDLKCLKTEFPHNRWNYSTKI